MFTIPLCARDAIVDHIMSCDSGYDCEYADLVTMNVVMSCESCAVNVNILFEQTSAF